MENYPPPSGSLAFVYRNRATNELTDFFARHFDHDHACVVHLTCKQSILGRGGFLSPADRSVLSREIRLWLNKLDRRVYGHSSRRHGKQVKTLPVIESSIVERLHLHVIFEVPERYRNRPEAFSKLAVETWKESDWARDRALSQEIWDLKGAIGYLLKDAAHDSVDWENVRIDGRRPSRSSGEIVALPSSPKAH